MSESELVGSVFIGFGAILSVFIPVLVYWGSTTHKLTKAITTLNVTMQHLLEHSDAHEYKLEKHTELLHQHDTEIQMIKSRL